MMKNTRKTKRTFKVFAAWDYEFEEREFNRMSEQGWQLVNGGSFSQKYEYDDSVIYRYQLDYNNEIKDMARYDETFRDAGWERVNSTVKPSATRAGRESIPPLTAGTSSARLMTRAFPMKSMKSTPTNSPAWKCSSAGGMSASSLSA